jgi:periplasmic protein TonB
MLTVLLESHATHDRSVGSTIVSALAHGVLLAAAVALTLPHRDHATASSAITATTVTYVTPPHRPSSPPALPRVPAAPLSTAPSLPRPELRMIDVPLVTPRTIPPVDVGPVLEPDLIRIGSGSHSGIPVGASEAGPGLGSSDVRDALAVDRAPRVLGRASEPRYPAQLRAAGTEGTVLAEFVVDTLGRAELDGLRFPPTANPLFSQSIREALARYHFVPGELGGKKVRTRVQMPFVFRLEKERR